MCSLNVGGESKVTEVAEGVFTLLIASSSDGGDTGSSLRELIATSELSETADSVVSSWELPQPGLRSNSSNHTQVAARPTELRRREEER